MLAHHGWGGSRTTPRGAHALQALGLCTGSDALGAVVHAVLAHVKLLQSMLGARPWETVNLGF